MALSEGGNEPTSSPGRKPEGAGAQSGDGELPESSILALWREAGEWWVGEPYQEFVRYIDGKGVRREEVRDLPTLGQLRSEVKPYEEDLTEDYILRVHKVRDEKVARACGYAPEPELPLNTDSDGSADPRPQQDPTSGTHGSADFSPHRGRGLQSPKGFRPAEGRVLSRLGGDVVERPAEHPQRRAEGLRTGATPGSLNKPHLDPSAGAPDRSQPSYAALHVYSGYAFGRATMLAEEIPIYAAQAGLKAVALADPFSLAGCVEFAKRAQAVGVKPLIGATLELECGGKLVLISRSKAGYSELAQLITACHLTQPRLYPLCPWKLLERHARDLLVLTGGDLGPLNQRLSQKRHQDAEQILLRLVELYGKANVFVEIERSYLPWERSINRDLLQLAESHDLMPVAGGLITHHRPRDFPTQDVLVCADTLCLIEEVIGRKPLRHESQAPPSPRPERALNAERYLRTTAEMVELFSDRVDLLENTLRVADRCDDYVLPARTQLPELFPDPAHALREIVEAGARLRYPHITVKLRRRIQHELRRIEKLNFASHFLAIWDACRWADEQGVLFSGRGSVVDSVVAYCLGLSRIDAFAHNLHFDRFLPEDGSKRPDIDVDFEASRRDEVRAYFARKYGEDRVAGIAAVGAYCTRGIIREVGKVLGLPNDVIGLLSKRVHGGVSADRLESALEARPELAKSGIPKERFKWVFELSERMMDIPRNMRAHSSGVVISSRPLAETVPVMWSASEEVRDRIPGAGRSPMQEADYPEDWAEPGQLRIIQWDKRSAKYFFDKFDVLCLRGQDVLSGTQERIRVQNPDFRVTQIPLDDEETYRAMRSGELIGIPQSASPAMRQAHIRMRTANLHDASLVQAGIRPGVGGAVKINELIARRRGKPYSFEHPDLEAILGLTYGIVVFQEQIDQLLQTFAGYSSGEAEEMREAIHKRRREDYGRMIKDQITAAIRKNGYSESVAEHVFELVAGFKGYGFAQGHALAFAEISIRSIACQQNFPADYFASLLSAQPAGYYGPCTLVNEARSRGVAILPPDVNRSALTFSVEDVKSAIDPQMVFPRGGIRVGLMQVHGLSAGLKERILNCRPASELSSLEGSPTQERHPAAHAKLVEADHMRAGRDRLRFTSFFDFVLQAQPSRDELENLILCGALDGLESNRRALLWAIPQAIDYVKAQPRPDELPFRIPEPVIDIEIVDFLPAEKAIHERALLGLDVEHHLMAFERHRVSSRGGITSREAKALTPGRKAFVVGNPIRLRFPPTSSGKRVVFFDLEDETGLLNVTCFDETYQQDGHAIICSPYVTVLGEAQDRDGHIAFLAHRVFPYKPSLLHASGVHKLPIATADFLVG